jgi:uncharacterized protein (DUF433 family)
MNLPPLLTQLPDGDIRFTGSRIGLLPLIHDHKRGWSPERLHEEFPSLPLETICAVLAFYEANRAEVDAYIAAYDAEAERLIAATPRSVKLGRTAAAPG